MKERLNTIPLSGKTDTKLFEQVFPRCVDLPGIRGRGTLARHDVYPPRRLDPPFKKTLDLLSEAEQTPICAEFRAWQVAQFCVLVELPSLDDFKMSCRREHHIRIEIFLRLSQPRLSMQQKPDFETLALHQAVVFRRLYNQMMNRAHYYGQIITDPRLSITYCSRLICCWHKGIPTLVIGDLSNLPFDGRKYFSW